MGKSPRTGLMSSKAVPLACKSEDSEVVGCSDSVDVGALGAIARGLGFDTQQ